MAAVLASCCTSKIRLCNSSRWVWRALLSSSKFDSNVSCIWPRLSKRAQVWRSCSSVMTVMSVPSMTQNRLNRSLGWTNSEGCDVVENCHGSRMFPVSDGTDAQLNNCNKVEFAVKMYLCMSVVLHACHPPHLSAFSHLWAPMAAGYVPAQATRLEPLGTKKPSY